MNKLHQPHYIDPRCTQAHLSLDGLWSLAYTASETNYPQELDYNISANVPDSLFWSLYKAKIMPKPYQGVNSKQYHWVDEKVWYYKYNFFVDKDNLDSTSILCFDGAAYYSRIWLNGNYIGEHEGMFGGPYINVSDKLNYGQANEIIIEIKACNFGNKNKKYSRNSSGINREIVPWNVARDSDTSNGDWIVMGLWRSVRIEFLSAVHISRPYLVTRAIENGNAQLSLELEIISDEINELHPFYAIKEDNTDYTFAYSNGMKQLYKENKCIINVRVSEKISKILVYEKNHEVELVDYKNSIRAKEYPESQFFDCNILIENAKLWWPHDMGVPFLYNIMLTISVDGKIVDSLSFMYGIRTIKAIRSSGPRVRRRWGNFQFVINGVHTFIKGVNWMQQDVLYQTNNNESLWSLELAKNAGIHLIRLWSGGGMPESDAFYNMCDEFGIMVWQDHFIANTSHTHSWPQEVLEAQEGVNIFRIRNHASLAVHCGGNEFNAYSEGNAASMFVIDRTIRTLDPCKIYYFTTPDLGSAHIYQDMEPTWYRHLYSDLPFVAETGIHSLPSFKALQECLNEQECNQLVPDMTSKEFQDKFPELLNHFAEYVPERVPRMLSRASQIVDLSNINLEQLAEATQIACCEYYQILAQALRENYPVTTGLMPWVFRRPWTTVGIQLVDGYGEPMPQYYYLKKAYQSIEAHLALENVSYSAGEKLSAKIRVCNEYDKKLNDILICVKAFSPELECLWEKTICALQANNELITLCTQKSWTDKYFFLTITTTKDNKNISKQVYWPKCLSALSNSQTLKEHRTTPQSNYHLANGPWLKPQIAACLGAKLDIKIVNINRGVYRTSFNTCISNIGNKAAFPVSIKSINIGTRCMASDNYFWLEACECREIAVVIDNKYQLNNNIDIVISAWNTEPVHYKI